MGRHTLSDRVVGNSIRLLALEEKTKRGIERREAERRRKKKLKGGIFGREQGRKGKESERGMLVQWRE